MAEPGSVTEWVASLKAGDSRAAFQLWERYRCELERRARQRLKGCPRGVADEEDVALSAFYSFLRAISKERGDWVVDRDTLWRFLATLVKHKAIDLIRSVTADARQVRNEAAFGLGDSDISPLRDQCDLRPGPEDQVLLKDLLERLPELGLRDELLQQIARLWLGGDTIAEIAEKVGLVKRTVYKKLDMIRNVWAGEIQG